MPTKNLTGINSSSILIKKYNFRDQVTGSLLVSNMENVFFNLQMTLAYEDNVTAQKHLFFHS